MRPGEVALSKVLDERVQEFRRTSGALPGIADPARRAVLVEQLVESSRRVRYMAILRERGLGPACADSSSDTFDPLKAALVRQRDGDTNDAFWLVFLAVHFGKHRRSGWGYVRDVYGALGESRGWDWSRVSADPEGFRRWLATNIANLQAKGHRFGNHRKYQSLDAEKPSGTGEALVSYVRWVAPPRTHEVVVAEALREARGDARRAFDILYRSMEAVASFGRTARFDYLATVGNLGLAPIEPGSPYLVGATGPRAGARLLFGPSQGASALDQRVVDLGRHLGVGMQVMEDALCNWQKSPGRFKGFRG